MSHCKEVKTSPDQLTQTTDNIVVARISWACSNVEEHKLWVLGAWKVTRMDMGWGKCGSSGFPANLGSAGQRPERDQHCHPPPSCPLPVSCSPSSSSSSGIRGAGGHSPVHCGVGAASPRGLQCFPKQECVPRLLLDTPTAIPDPQA